jgi:predicted dehydrogenase
MKLSRRTFLAATTGAIASAYLPRASADEKPLGWALVGLGNLAINQLMPALTKTKSAKLVALVSGHPDKANRLAKQYSVDPKHIYNYDNFDSIKDDAEIDVVYIVLPNGMHAEYTVRAAKAGKHVFSEKPMANTAAECQQMIDACRDAKKLLGVGYRMQYEPHLVEAKRLIKEGSIGKLKKVESEFGFNIPAGAWRLEKKLAGGGPLMDVGIYCLNSARFALGEEPVEVNATIPDANGDGRFKQVEPAMDFTLTFPSGAVANCKTSYREFVGNRLRIEGETGSIHMEPAFSYGGLMMGVKHGDNRPETFTPKPADQFAAEIEEFSRCIIEGKPTRTPGEEGMRDCAIMEALYASAAQKKPITLKNASAR